MLSMTGYGQAVRSAPELDVQVEVKTVNARYLDIQMRLPRELFFLEGKIRRQVQKHLGRGRVEVYVNLNLKSSRLYELNEPLVRNFQELINQARQYGIQGQLEVASLLQLPGVLVQRPLDLSSPELFTPLLEALTEAVEAVLRVRAQEGESLRRDLLGRVRKLEDLQKRMGEEAVSVREHYRAKLLQRWQELQLNLPVDENRLLQEVLYYTEKADISEELTRLKSHLSRFAAHLQEENRSRVGRELDFLCQEMNREVNTILSKSPLVGLSKLALEAKAEVEKVREQVQNVE